MNYSLYLFGTNKGTYIQYPYDGEEAFLRSLCTDKKDTRLTIYRKGSLTYYAFLMLLDTDLSQVFGICIVTNGVYIKDIKVLHQTFDKIFSRIVFNGKILRLTGTGKISYLSDNFASDKIGIEQTEILAREIVKENLDSYAVQTKQNFSGLIATKNIALEERNSEILRAIEQNNVVNIYSGNNAYSSISYVKQTISKLYKENSELREDYRNLQSQKKQYRNVVLLAFAILICGFGMFFLYDNLNSTQGQLAKAKSTIVDKKNVIKMLNTSKDSLRLCLNNEKLEKRDLENKLSAIFARVPFVITNCSIDAEEITIDYYAVEQKDITIYLKAINESEPEVVSNSHSVTIYEGKHQLKLKFNYRLNPVNYYYVNILYDGNVIGGKRW